MHGTVQGTFLESYVALGWPKWLKSLGTAGTSAFPILFTKLFWKMAKKFKNFGVLGCLIAVEEMADFTLWFQQKYDFFGTSSVLTPLVALKTQPNLWKQLFLCQCTSQGPKITKSELLEGFKHFEWQWSTGQWGERVSFCHFLLFSSHSMASDPNPNVCQSPNI